MLNPQHRIQIERLMQDNPDKPAIDYMGATFDNIYWTPDQYIMNLMHFIGGSDEN